MNSKHTPTAGAALVASSLGTALLPGVLSVLAGSADMAVQNALVQISLTGTPPTAVVKVS